MGGEAGGWERVGEEEEGGRAGREKERHRRKGRTEEINGVEEDKGDMRKKSGSRRNRKEEDVITGSKPNQRQQYGEKMAIEQYLAAATMKIEQSGDNEKTRRVSEMEREGRKDMYLSFPVSFYFLILLPVS